LNSLLLKNKLYIRRLVLIGIFVGTAYILGFYGLKLSTSINYGFLIKSTLLFTTILAFIFLKEKFNSEKVILLFVFVIGVYFLTTGGKMIIPRIGDILTLITAFCYSSALIITKPLTKEIHSDIVSLGRIGFALLVLFLLIPILKVNPLEIKAGIYVLITGVFGAILAIFINKTITVSSASYLTMMSMSVPVIVALLSLIFLKEPMNIFQIIGGTLIIVSGVLTQKSKI
jgi:drug/metabolite transporter (DMT)-like permease